MKEDTQAKKWMWGTLLVGAAAVILLIWAGNVVLYPTYMHWRGLPTEADKAELYAFAEKLGYEPENEVTYARFCNGWGSAQSCYLKLIFLETQPLDASFFQDRSTLMLTNTERRRSADASTLLYSLNANQKNVQIDGAFYGPNLSQSDLKIEMEALQVIDTQNENEWAITVFETSALAVPVYFKGQLISRDMISINKSIRCGRNRLGICN